MSKVLHRIIIKFPLSACLVLRIFLVRLTATERVGHETIRLAVGRAQVLLALAGQHRVPTRQLARILACGGTPADGPSTKSPCQAGRSGFLYHHPRSMPER